MTGYSFAVWSALILAELLAISLILNLVWLRQRRRAKAGQMAKMLPAALTSIIAKAKAIKDMYRQIATDNVPDIPTILADVSTQEAALEELLQTGILGHRHDPQSSDSDPLQPIWNDMCDGHALLSSITAALFGKTKIFHDVMEKMQAQEELLQELSELSTTYQRGLKDLTDDHQHQQLTQEMLDKLMGKYQALQKKLDELTLSNQDILRKDSHCHTFSEQYRTFFETLQNLKVDNLRMSERLRLQDPKLEWLRREKTRMEEEVERLRGLDEAHRAARRKATQLEEQLQRANEENQRLKSEINALTAEYLKLFESQSA